MALSAPSSGSVFAPMPSLGRLYLLFTPTACRQDPFTTLTAALDGGVDLVQWRSKVEDLDGFRRCRELCRSRNVPLVVNDDVMLAKRSHVAGVHVGQTDWPYAKARKAVGANAIVGVTCHDSRHLAMEAAEAGADYVAFGAFYPTTTKPSHYRPEPELLEWWSEMMEVPCVAIGGITAENCAPLVQAGADFICVVTAVWNHPEGPGAGVKALNAAIEAAAAG